MKYVAATSIYLHIYLIADIEVSRRKEYVRVNSKRY